MWVNVCLCVFMHALTGECLQDGYNCLLVASLKGKLEVASMLVKEGGEKLLVMQKEVRDVGGGQGMCVFLCCGLLASGMHSLGDVFACLLACGCPSVLQFVCVYVCECVVMIVRQCVCVD